MARPSRQRPSLAVQRTLRTIGDHVATWRRLRGLTQTQVADRAGIGVATVRKLETGDGAIGLENTLRVLRALGIADSIADALDPYADDVGRLRSEQQLPTRVRPRDLTRDG